MFSLYGVNKVFVISPICRKNNYLNGKATKIIFFLRLVCKEKGLVFLDNWNIDLHNLWKDDMHLPEGKCD